LIEEAKTGREVWLSELEKLARSLLALPSRTDQMLTRMERGELAVRNPELTQQVKRLEGAVRQIIWGIVFSALLLGSVQLYLADEFIIAAVLIISSLIVFLGLFGNGRRRR